MRPRLLALAFALGALAAAPGGLAADNCGDLSDCEQTAGYLTAVGVIGGLIAVISGLLGGSVATSGDPPPSGPPPDGTAGGRGEPPVSDDPRLIDPDTGEPLLVNDGTYEGGEIGQVWSPWGGWVDPEVAAQHVRERQAEIDARESEIEEFWRETQEESERRSREHEEEAAQAEAERQAQEVRRAQADELLRRGRGLIGTVDDPVRRAELEAFLTRHSDDPDALRRAVDAIRKQTFEADQQRSMGEAEAAAEEGAAYGHSERFAGHVRAAAEGGIAAVGTAMSGGVGMAAAAVATGAVSGAEAGSESYQRGDSWAAAARNVAAATAIGAAQGATNVSTNVVVRVAGQGAADAADHLRRTGDAAGAVVQGAIGVVGATIGHGVDQHLGGTWAGEAADTLLSGVEGGTRAAAQGGDFEEGFREGIDGHVAGRAGGAAAGRAGRHASDAPGRRGGGPVDEGSRPPPEEEAPGRPDQTGSRSPDAGDAARTGDSDAGAAAGLPGEGPSHPSGPDPVGGTGAPPLPRHGEPGFAGIEGGGSPPPRRPKDPATQKIDDHFARGGGPIEARGEGGGSEEGTGGVPPVGYDDVFRPSGPSAEDGAPAGTPRDGSTPDGPAPGGTPPDAPPTPPPDSWRWVRDRDGNPTHWIDDQGVARDPNGRPIPELNEAVGGPAEEGAPTQVPDHSGEGGWSPEAVSRMRSNDFYDLPVGGGQGTQVRDPGVIDQTAGRRRVIVQVDKRTGEKTVISWGEGIHPDERARILRELDGRIEGASGGEPAPRTPPPPDGPPAEAPPSAEPPGDGAAAVPPSDGPPPESPPGEPPSGEPGPAPPADGEPPPTSPTQAGKEWEVLQTSRGVDPRDPRVQEINLNDFTKQFGHLPGKTPYRGDESPTFDSVGLRTSPESGKLDIEYVASMKRGASENADYVGKFNDMFDETKPGFQELKRDLGFPEGSEGDIALWDKAELHIPEAHVEAAREALREYVQWDENGHFFKGHLGEFTGYAAHLRRQGLNDDQILQILQSKIVGRPDA